MGSGFKVQGAGFRVQGAGFRVQGSGCRVQGSGCRVQGLGFRVHRFRVWGFASGFDPTRRVQGSAPPPAKKTAGQIEKETLKKRISNPPEADCKHRIMNVEVMYSACREFFCRTARRELLCRTACRELLCRTACRELLCRTACRELLCRTVYFIKND